MKKLVLAIALAAVSTGAFARVWHGGPHHGGWHGGYHHGWHGGYHHYHGGYWGRGGCNFRPAFDGSFLTVRSPASGISDSHGVTGGVYKTRERIHRDILIRDY